MTQDTATQNNVPASVDETTYQALANFDIAMESGSIKKAMQEAGASSGDLWKVDPFKLKVLPGFNTRLDPVAFRAHVDHLKELIRKNGYYQDQPLTGFVAIDPDNEGKNGLFVTEGHHRLVAVQELITEENFVVNPKKGTNEVSFLPKDGKTPMVDISIAAYHSNQAKRSHTTLETAIHCLRLKETYKLETFQVAERLGLTKPYVETLLLLARAPIEIRNMVQIGQVSASIAIDTLRKKGDEAKAVLTKAVEAAEKRAEAAEKAKPPSKKEEPKKEEVATTSVATENPKTEQQPGDVIIKTTPAAPKPATKPVVKVKMNDVAPETKLLKLQQELGPRLFVEVQRMEKEGIIKTAEFSPELEKLLFLVESVNSQS